VIGEAKGFEGFLILLFHTLWLLRVLLSDSIGQAFDLPLLYDFEVILLVNQSV